ncbi:MAG: TonB family protein [Syntrophales bacterium]|nr:TonB family protein [Syntrophales bacterium]
MVDLEGEWIEKEKNQPTTIMESLKEKTELPAIKQQGNSRPLEGKKEDTVDLGNLVNTHYKPYLVKIKKRIERFWGYPSAAAARRIEGTAMILFSVAADGALDSIMITTSSGSALLDQGTISAIQSASPFEPLPPAYGLSKLNIQASFAYKLSN